MITVMRGVQVGWGKWIFRFKTVSLSIGSAVGFCRPGVAITPGGQSSDMPQSSREAA